MPGLETQRTDTDDMITLPQQVANVPEVFPNIDTGSRDTLTSRIQSEVTTNVTAPMVLAHLLLPHLLSLQRQATFVLVSSGLAFVPFPLYPVYCPTKAAIHFFAVALGAQLVGSSCRVVELTPPYVDTALKAGHGAEMIEAQGGEEKALKPMPLEAWLDTIMVNFKEDSVNEITTGFRKWEQTAWRTAFGLMLERRGVQRWTEGQVSKYKSAGLLH
ncbi:MAG: hypothetical protein Q9212_003096 [Teloschistes hypoglaucus]